MLLPPGDALDLLRSHCQQQIATELVPLHTSLGRVLAETVTLDVDSPAADVSAMDGYAIRLADGPTYQLQGTMLAGQRPLQLQRAHAVHVMTGAVVPNGTQAVVPQEHVRVDDNSVTISEATYISLREGQNIRTRGENAAAGTTLLEPGVEITLARLNVLACAGKPNVKVIRPVRLAVCTTGAEVIPIAQRPEPHQVRNSNSALLEGMFRRYPWIHVVEVAHVADNQLALNKTIDRLMAATDVVVLAGGVSVGLKDLVPSTFDSLGISTLFRGVAIKPGRPMMAGRSASGKLAFALPGNPLAALVTARRFMLPTLAVIAGFENCQESLEHRIVTYAEGGRRAGVWVYRPAVCDVKSHATVVHCRGAGDPIGIVHANGMVELPPDDVQLIDNSVNFYSW